MVFDFKMTFTVENEHRLAFNVSVPKAFTDYTNFLELKFRSGQDEEIYGMGLQFSTWNFKGQEDVPLVTTEPGVGRGLQPVTELKGIDGGTDTMSYASTASFITNKQRGFICWNTHMGRANFTQNDIQLLYWHTNEISGVLISGESPLVLA